MDYTLIVTEDAGQTTTLQCDTWTELERHISVLMRARLRRSITFQIFNHTGI